jgi:hypothetical protein
LECTSTHPILEILMTFQKPVLVEWYDTLVWGVLYRGHGSSTRRRSYRLSAARALFGRMTLRRVSSLFFRSACQPSTMTTVAPLNYAHHCIERLPPRPSLVNAPCHYASRVLSHTYFPFIVREVGYNGKVESLLRGLTRTGRCLPSP